MSLSAVVRWFTYLEKLSRIMLTKLSFDTKLHKLMLLWIKVINYELRWSNKMS